MQKITSVFFILVLSCACFMQEGQYKLILNTPEVSNNPTPSSSNTGDGLSDSGSSGFNSGTNTGTSYSTSTGALTVSATSSHAELDESWAPRWSQIVGYWRFNEGAWLANATGTIIDQMGLNHGTPRGNASSTSAKFGAYAGNFDGAGDYVEVADSASLDLLVDGVSISLWIRPGFVSGGLSKCIVSKYAAGGWQLCYHSGDYLYFYVSNGIAVQSSSGRLKNSVWQHLLITYDDTLPDGRFYLNGIDITASTSSRNFVADNVNLSLGSESGGGFSMLGGLDEVALWKQKLNQDEVLLIYNRQYPRYSGVLKSRIIDSQDNNSSWSGLDWSTTLPFGKELPDGGSPDSESSSDYSSLATSTLLQDIVGLWHFNEFSWSGAANEVRDGSGNGNHGGARNGSNTFSGGLFNRTGNFDGVNDSVLITDSLSNRLSSYSAFTISAWFFPKRANNTSWPTIYSYGRWGFSIGLDSATGKLESWINNGTEKEGNTPVNLNQWNHVAVQVNGTNMRYYLNGILDSTHNIPVINLMTSGTGIGDVSTSSNSSYFHGLIDEVAVWGRALSSTDILQLFRRGANKIKFQVRSCANADCSDQDALTGDGWMGPGGNYLTYFSELQNNDTMTVSCLTPQACYASEVRATGEVLATPASLSFGDLGADGISVNNNRYFQYRSIMESHDQVGLCSASSACMPELKSVTIGPSH